MSNRNLQKIKKFLQDAEVQNRVRENIRKSREEAKVTIGRASELFNIKPSKLRELDALLQPERSTGTETGQRQYSLAELQKLAVVSELIRAGCPTAEIPPHVDRLWQDAAGLATQQESCILVGNNPHLPLPMRSLIVRAQSKDSPHTIGTTIVSPDTPYLSLSLRAFQSNHVIYRQVVSTEDSTIALRMQEEPIGSAIAVPVGGKDDLPVAVLYVVSAEANAFSEEDQRVLRIMAQMVSERLMIYQIRQKAVEKLRIAVIEPRVVDELFKEFDSENKFIKDVEDLLHGIRTRYTLRGNDETTSSPSSGYDDKREPYTSEVLSFISIDIDNQSFLATKYGDHIARNLCRELGKRIRA